MDDFQAMPGRLVNDPILQPLSWDALLRRRSSMSVGLRRSSLLSVSLFDNPSFHGIADESDHDPFAPLSFGDVNLPSLPLNAHQSHLNHLQQQQNQIQLQQYQLQLQQQQLQQHLQQTTTNNNNNPHHVPSMMNDRSESSVPSLSASSYSSNGSANMMMHPGANNNMLYKTSYDGFPSFSPQRTLKQPVQMPLKVMSTLSAPYVPLVHRDIITSSSAGGGTSRGVVDKTGSNNNNHKSHKNKDNEQDNDDDHDEDDDDDEDDDEHNQHRFKPFHEEKWTVRYKELLEFHKENDHSAVPHTYPKNPQLARWVKRQRRQYKLRRDGRASTMTTERLEMLSSVGFVWDSHDVNWREKLDALTVFRKEHCHCNVPSNYVDKKLATWVKCQRRQYKLYWDGKPSAMSPERILELEKVGFEWEIRSTVPRKSTTPTAQEPPAEQRATTPVPPTNDFGMFHQGFPDL